MPLSTQLFLSGDSGLILFFAKIWYTVKEVHLFFRCLKHNKNNNLIKTALLLIKDSLSGTIFAL